MMCDEAVRFDVATTAGWYSAVAGLLAGFALLAIPLTVDQQSSGKHTFEDRRSGDGVALFVSAFFALLILSFTFAVIAGFSSEGIARAVAAHELQLNGAVFGFASLLLLLGVKTLLQLRSRDSGAFESGQRLIVNAAGLYGPIVVLAFQFRDALDVETYRAAPNNPVGGAECAHEVSDGVWINLVIALIAIAALIAMAVSGQRLPRQNGLALFAGQVTLGFAVAVALWTTMVVSFLPVDFVTGALLEHLTLGVTAVGCIAFGAAARLSA
ncbi:hypothetical protein [Streptomyces sp. NPDC055749]